jgi:hypothetical protein
MRAAAWLPMTTLLVVACRTPPLEEMSFDLARSSTLDLATRASTPDLSLCPGSRPPYGSVTLAVTNESEKDRFVAVASESCSSIAVEGLILYNPFADCGCDCPKQIGEPRVLSYRRVRPNESFQGLSFRRSSYAFCEPLPVCGDGPGKPPGAQVYIPSGTYRITVAVEASLPASCTPDPAAPDQFTCGNWLTTGETVPFGPPYLIGLCPTGLPTSGEVNLPDGQFVTANLSLR